MSPQINSGRPLLADAERTVQTILEAAERTLGRDPAATMEDVAAAAGVARTTVHQRFPTREALITAMASWATQQFAAAVDTARPDTAPPVVALYQATANMLRVKIGWGFSMSCAPIEGGDVERVYAGIVAKSDRLFRRAQEAGIVRDDADLIWGRRVYYALIHEVSQDVAPDEDTDALATQVVDTLLRGIGTQPAHL